VAVGNAHTYDWTRRGARAPSGRALRGLLWATVLAGSLATGGALVGTGPAGAEPTASGTCTPALAPTAALTAVLVEQFAETALGVADRAAIVLHGRVAHEGTPHEMAQAAPAAYL
jgi:hypothetical protein